jgi:dihydrofolate synthase/folylpolyglutamate synthase
MSVDVALKLSGRPAGRIRPQLDGLRRVLREMGNPQRDFSSILVVGTNGKGSTAAMLEGILRAHDLDTGLFTSPHLVRIEERIRLNGRPIEGSILSRELARLDDYPELTYFEALTAVAFAIFSEAGVDVAVLEAGMGGSWDATRLAESAIAGITNVGTDHSRWLGREPATIARDKGRALAAAGRSVIGPGLDATLVAELDAPHAVAAETIVRSENHSPGFLRLKWGRLVLDVRPSLSGRFQVDNLRLAVALAIEAEKAGFVELDADRVRSALEGVNWPGRLSRHVIAGREILIDCAHNLEAAEALAQHLRTLVKRYNLVFSCLDDKPVDEMAKVLKPQVRDVAVYRLDDDRAMSVERLLSAFPEAVVAADAFSALDLLRDPVIAAGSIRVAGDLLADVTSVVRS